MQDGCDEINISDTTRTGIKLNGTYYWNVVATDTNGNM
jgi:hypothetical protein